MSRVKALHPKRRLRQNKKIHRLFRAAESRQRSFRSKKLGWLEIVEPARCGYSGQTSTGNDRDNDSDCGDNDGRHTDSTAGNRIDNKVWRNTGTDNSNRKGYTLRNSPDRSRY